jgi:flagellar basal body-associated protein FliL
MKSFPLMLIVIFLSVICVLNIGLVSALDQDEASVQLLWSSQAVYSGEIVTVRITFTSSSADQLRIYRIGFHFDWMGPNEFYTSDFTDNPVVVTSFGTNMFNPIAIQIPSNVSVGTYNYYVGVDGTQGGSLTTFTWDSPTFTIEVNPMTEKVYNDLKTQVDTKLTAAISANYQSSEAKSLVQQAQDEVKLAQTSANDGEWTAAISSLENASNYLDQASTAEQENKEQQENMQTLLFYVAIIAVVVIVVVAIVVVVVRRRRKRTDYMAEQPSDQPDQPMETYEEEQG